MYLLLEFLSAICLTLVMWFYLFMYFFMKSLY